MNVNERSSQRDKLKEKFSETFSGYIFFDWCLFISADFRILRNDIKINFTNCLSKILERFFCCFSIVWTQLQHRNIINSVFVNTEILPLISSTTTISICLTRRCKGLRVKYSFFYKNFRKILTNNVSHYCCFAAKPLLVGMSTSKT